MIETTLYSRLPDGTLIAIDESNPNSLPEKVLGPRPSTRSAAQAAAALAAGGAAASSAGDQTAPQKAAPQPTPVRQPAPPRQAPAAALPRTAPPGGPAKPKKKWTPWRVLKWIVASYFIFYLSMVAYVMFTIPQISALPAKQIPDTRGTNWLLVGSDSREGLTKQEQKELKTGSVEGARTDTIMVLHFGGGDKATLMSIPRDSWVTIPAGKSTSGNPVNEQNAKINAAYAIGGPTLLIQTVEKNTGLHIDHYGEVGFYGIVALTDAVDGVTLCPSQDFKDKNSGLNIKAGCQEVDGATSLAYVRMRYADPKGDLGRAERQQEYVAALVDEVLSPLTLLNPVDVWQIANAGAKSLTIDEDSGPIALGRLGVAMSSVAAGRGQALTVPVASANTMINGQSTVQWDNAEAQKLFRSMGAN